ncbi:hypothetical protein NCS57_01256200 [Fusarium keratoplasticum]|uniref:Uncharacterized protein n=1 Tax=Fusarium keratoplasticum TaxID=1328300 RepID=A0ACC0QJA7_9HYPO|nr:hypothetical protein NCS57_01256200 [Fusarium keratoplasticum]KAI8655085.1 hypothetical protein NCS57_01256200 [Fusarium keratoplasticum]
MRNSTAFLEVKHKFRGVNANNKAIPVLHLENPDSIHDDFVQNRKLVNPGTELEPLFDQQIKEITEYISERVRQLNEPLESLQSCSIFLYPGLSSALGGSWELTLRQAPTGEICDKGSKLKSARLVVSSEPQLAVCMGLVSAASNNQPVFPTIACCTSFDLVSRIPSAPPAKRTWIFILRRGKGIEGRFDDCVDWIISKGKQIQNGGELEFERKLFFEPDERRVRNIGIVYSLADGPSPSKVMFTAQSRLEHPR